MAPGEGPL